MNRYLGWVNWTPSETPTPVVDGYIPSDHPAMAVAAFPGPVLSDRELACTSVEEEAAEAIQELCKARRFGMDGRDPRAGDTPGERLAGEIGDLMGSIDFLLKTHPDLDRSVILNRRLNKEQKLRHYNDPANWGIHYEPKDFLV